MAGFGTLVKRAKRRHAVKVSGGKWGRCEECDDRSILYPFNDKKNQIWMLCEGCSDLFVKDEDEG